MGGSKASSTQTTTTQNISDSYNSTLNRVSNLSEVGNVSLNFGSTDPVDALPSLSTLLPFAVVAIVGVLGVLMLKR